MDKIIYMDHAATTPVDPRVIEEMLPYFHQKFYNPSSLYTPSREVRKKVEDCRVKLVELLGASHPNEVIFTSGGTESNNLFIKGMAWALKDKGMHIITTMVEHHAVLHAFGCLEKMGFQATYLPVDKYGMVNPEDVEKALRSDTILVSVMMANNEVGTVMPIKEIGEVLRSRDIIFHTDAVQAIGSLEVNMRDLGVDALSLSSHKFYGPKGIGALVIKKDLKPEPLIHGGSQERHRRAGTENVPGIIGMTRALELAVEEREERNKKITGLRDMLIKGIMSEIPDVILTGHPEKRLPNNASFCFKYVEGESILLHLDMHGISASSGSACTSGSLNPSHVLLSMGLPHEIAHGSLRLTLGRDNTGEDVKKVLDILPGIIERLRDMSPLYPVKKKAVIKGSS
ncbi:MAG: cysteine desulfurase NifS [Candidatus Eremiobacteraeota bacterium]|nr:cysteine desulfurase NifS [Candidatus Eremiobacteraeota bacterium]